MDELEGMQRDAQIMLGATVLYVVVSFLNWQVMPVPNLNVAIVQSEWDGIGIAAGLLSFVLLTWELGRALRAQFTMRTSRATTSLVLALLLALFTVITFLAHGTGRHWPAWIGLVIGLAIAAVAWKRGQREGVRLPALGA